MGNLLLGVGVILVVFWSVKHCSSLSSIHCAQVGQSEKDFFVWDFRDAGDYTRVKSRDYFDLQYNYYSIGGDLFSNEYQKALGGSYTPKDVLPDSAECYLEVTPITNKRDAQICVNDTTLNLRTYYVRQNGVILKGWLHFEVELPESSDDKIMLVYMQVIDENFNAVGEFVHEDYNVNLEQHCPPTKSHLAHPTIYQYLPCTATGFREPKNSQGLYLVQPKYLFNKANEAYTQRGSLDRGFHVTWRFGENWCSRHLRFRPDMYIVTEKNKEAYLKFRREIESKEGWRKDHTRGHDGHRVYRKAGDHWLLHEYFGAWDAQHKSKGTLECDGGNDDMYLVMENQNLNLVQQGWIRESLKYRMGDDYYAEKQSLRPPTGLSRIKSCQVDPGADFYRDSKAKLTKFGGRCASLFDKDPPPTKEQFQDCSRSRTDPEYKNMLGWETYHNYTHNLTATRNATCRAPCLEPDPNNQTHAETIASFPRGNITVAQARNNSIFSYRPQTTFKRFWRGRKFHGIMCTISAMFVTPISIFVARYYKETFMSFECVGAKAWYWIHVGTSVANIALYFTSQTAIAPSIATMGNNVDAAGVVHRVFGWLSHSMFVILVLLGGFRVGPTANQKLIRLISILSHAIAGYVQYFVNVLLIMQSSWVPGSPSVPNCGGDGYPNGFSAVASIALVWLLIDIAFHSALTTLQYMTDKRHVKREAYCVLIPVMSPSSHDDLIGSNLRKLLLPIYAGVCGVITFTAVMFISIPDLPKTCGFGKMSCEDPLGCSPYAVALRKRITEAAEQAAP